MHCPRQFIEASIVMVGRWHPLDNNGELLLLLTRSGRTHCVTVVSEVMTPTVLEEKGHNYSYDRETVRPMHRPCLQPNSPHGPRQQFTQTVSGGTGLWHGDAKEWLVVDSFLFLREDGRGGQVRSR